MRSHARLDPREQVAKHVVAFRFVVQLVEEAMVLSGVQTVCVCVCVCVYVYVCVCDTHLIVLSSHPAFL